MYAALLCMFLKLELCFVEMVNLVDFTCFTTNYVRWDNFSVTYVDWWEKGFALLLHLLSVKQYGNYISTCIRITKVRKIFVLFINNSLEARRIEYKRGNLVTNYENQNISCRKKKKKKKEKKRDYLKSNSSLLQFFHKVRPWIAGL